MEETYLQDGSSEKELDECVICHGEIKIRMFDKDICSKCAYDIFEGTSRRIDRLDEEIRRVYSIDDNSRIDTIPFQKCNCGGNDIVTIDYFTPPADDNDFFELCICGVCRSCLGYRVVKVDNNIIPFNLRSKPSHVGINLSEFEDKKTIDKEQVGYIY